jgi:hypothetical protein
MAPRPIEVAGSGGAKMSAEAADGAPMDQSLAGDMIAPYPYQVTTFVAGEGLPALPTNDVGYMFEAGSPATSEQVAALAAALAVEGEPVAVEEGTTTSWRVGPEDGSAPSLWVGGDAQLSWSYNSAWATQEMSRGGCAVAGSTGAGEAEAPPADVAVAEESVEHFPEVEPATTDVVCDTPAPPEGVPAADEAESRTKDLMVAIGLDPAAYEFETYGDEWYASVTATEQLDGSFPGRNLSTGFGAEGVMQYAGGQLAEPVRVGPYPLIDLDAALARLNDPSGFYGGGGMIALDSSVARAATDEPVAVDVAEAPVGSAVEIAPSPSTPSSEPTPVGEPATGGIEPVEPPVSLAPTSIPAPESVTVTLVDVQPDVWWTWDVDGTAWLLPAYRFIGDDGGWYTVPAVTDEFLIQVPVSVPVTEPAPLPVDTLPADPGVPPVTTPIDTVVDVTALEASVGKTLAEFSADAKALGLEVRVTEQDGVPLAATMDYNPMRVNVAVEGEGDTGTVTAILNVG